LLNYQQTDKITSEQTSYSLGSFDMSDDKTIIADGDALGLPKPQKKIQACLIQYSGKELGKRFQLDSDSMTIGRSGDVNILINEQSVSRQHARCHTNGQKTEIEDMGSSNGTYINDQRIAHKTALSDGDIIRVGNILLKYYSSNNMENMLQDKLYRDATIDAGTQTFNKKHLLESLESEFNNSRKYGTPLTLIYFDLDHFKKVNDTHGHNAGDQVLLDVAKIVKGSIRKEDILCRFGGEEFIILMPNTDARTAYESAERIRSSIEAYSFSFNHTQIKQTISLGISQLNPSMTTQKDLLDNADRKLYQSKQNGRNQVTV